MIHNMEVVLTLILKKLLYHTVGKEYSLISQKALII